MKKSIIVILLLILSIISLKAQDKYFSFNIAYGLEAFPSRIATYYNVNNNDNEVKIQQPEFSLGEGIKYDLSVGYLIYEGIGLEFKFRYDKGKIIEFQQESIIATSTQIIDQYLSGNRITLIPSLIFQKQFGNIFTKINMGVSFNSVKQRLIEEKYVGQNELIQKWKYQGDMSAGFYSSFSMGYLFSEKILVNLSFAFDNMSYRPNRMLMTHSHLNNVSNIKSLKTFEKEIDFVDWSYDPFNQPQQDEDKPTLLQSETFSYGNFNINLGVSYFF